MLRHPFINTGDFIKVSNLINIYRNSCHMENLRLMKIFILQKIQIPISFKFKVNSLNFSFCIKYLHVKDKLKIKPKINIVVLFLTLSFNHFTS